MATVSSSSAQPLAASLYTQGRLAEARRNAARAESEARALAASAQSAQASADRAQEHATVLQVQADHANDNAGRARQGLVALNGIAAARSELGQRAARAAERSGTADEAPAVTAPVLATVPGVTVATAPVVGSIIDVQA